MPVLVTGAEGMLGRLVCAELKAKRVEYVPADIIGDNAHIDIADPDDLFEAFGRIRPEAVINCAAMTNVDGCETEIDLAYKLNAVGPQNLACACVAYGAVLTHVSTDYVFDGKKGSPYTEFDKPNPLGVYGASKLAGEEAIREICPNHYIVRTSWLYAPHGKNFALTMLRLAETRDEIKVVADQYGSPTYAKDLAEFLVYLHNSPMFGTYHFTNSGVCSWHEFAAAILEGAGKSVKVTPISTEEYPTPTERPKYSVLRHYRMELMGLDKARPWQETVKEFNEEIKNNNK
ncbi:MAG: dTDP-4-dehydrorhamnose reductase [Abditibacteriota bacterium]|nr:dTDP-4-dehydrorhamnose reductase [Abditibacteriota bacterium]MBP5738859.1 dTDP-4-dehydrorhamnose reductase [Abditibacteriota bacterium]